MDFKDKQKNIIRTVEKLAVRRKLSEITLDEVARTAKIGKGTIYNYFRNKESLFFEVATFGLDELCDLIVKKFNDNSSSFYTYFNDRCSHIIQFFANRQQLLQIMQEYTFNTYLLKSKFRERWMAKRKKLINAVSTIISAGIDEGLIRLDLPPDFLAVLLLGMLRTYVRDVDILSEHGQKAEVLADIFLNGAGQRHNDLMPHYSQSFSKSK